MSPIHVADVAQFFVNSIRMDETKNKTFKLGGKDKIIWKDIINKIAIASGRKKYMIPAPLSIIKFIASLLENYPFFPVTRDQLVMLVEGNTVSKTYFKNFNIIPTNFSVENLEYLKP